MGNIGNEVAHLNLERTDLEDAPADMSPELAALVEPTANMASAPEPERAAFGADTAERAVAVRVSSGLR